MDAKAGSKVPDFEGVDQRGNTVALRSELNMRIHADDALEALRKALSS